MNKLATIGAVILVAFVAGFASARALLPAVAASTPLTPQVIDVGALSYDALPPSPAGAGLRSKNFVTLDGMTLDVQSGPTARHFHTEADEIQYVIEGTGTEWLGDKQVTLKPGLMLLIPHGTPHGGTLEMSGHVKLLAIHAPPIQPGGTKPFP